MRIRSGVVLAVVSVIPAFSGALAPAASAAQVGACTATLACTAEQINAMSMPQRLAFLRSISPCAAPGYAPRWGNAECVIEFFADRGLGAAGSWVSYVDAADVEAIEQGIAIAKGHGTDTFGNPGTAPRADYLPRLRAGRLADRSVHDRVWSAAEQASIDDGVALAEHVHGLSPTPLERRFFQFTQFYRWVLRNRPGLLDLASPPIGPGTEHQLTFLDWFTDVTNDVPARAGAAFSYDVAQFDARSSLGDFVEIVQVYAAYFTQG